MILKGKRPSSALQTKIHLAQPDEIRFCGIDLSSFPFCRAKKPGIQLPKYHFIDHRIEILEKKDNYNQVVLYEKAAARYSPFPVMATK